MIQQRRRLSLHSGQWSHNTILRDRKCSLMTLLMSGNTLSNNSYSLSRPKLLSMPNMLQSDNSRSLTIQRYPNNTPSSSLNTHLPKQPNIFQLHKQLSLQSSQWLRSKIQPNIRCNLKIQSSADNILANNLRSLSRQRLLLMQGKYRPDNSCSSTARRLLNSSRQRSLCMHLMRTQSIYQLHKIPSQLSNLWSRSTSLQDIVYMR